MCYLVAEELVSKYNQLRGPTGTEILIGRIHKAALST